MEFGEFDNHIINPHGHGIQNSGLLTLNLSSTYNIPGLTIDVSGIRIINENSGTVEHEDGLLVIQSKGSSIENDGNYMTEGCTTTRVNRWIESNGNFTNNGNIEEITSSNCNIQENNGNIHNLGGGTFDIDTDNGNLSTDPDVHYVTGSCQFSGVLWWLNRAWSRWQVPSLSAKVFVTSDATFYNTGNVEGETHSAYLKIKSLHVPAGVTLDIFCSILEVDELHIDGTVNVGDNGMGYGGQLIINEQLQNNGTLNNEGMIENLGSSAGNAIVGAGTVRTSRGTVSWITYASNTN